MDTQNAPRRDTVDLVAAATPALPALRDAFAPGMELDVERLDPKARAAMLKIANEVPRVDSAAVNGFGAPVQERMNGFLDELMGDIRAKDAGASGSLLAQVATGIRMIDIPGLKREAEGKGGPLALLAGLPVVGKRVSAFQRFVANRRAVEGLFAEIEAKGRTEMAKLQATDAKLDRLVDRNVENLRDLELHVMAGQVILKRERAAFAAERDRALASRDPVEIARVRDRAEQVDGFEVRLLRLHQAMTQAMLAIPQTRLAQEAGRIEYRNVLDTLLFDLPQLKAAIVRVAALRDIAAARKGTDARRALARQMEDAGIEALGQAYARAKESEGGSLDEIRRMGEIADRIVGIIDRGTEIDARNRATRAQAHEALAETQRRLVAGLVRSTAGAVEAARFRTE